MMTEFEGWWGRWKLHECGWKPIVSEPFDLQDTEALRPQGDRKAGASKQLSRIITKGKHKIQGTLKIVWHNERPEKV